MSMQDAETLMKMFATTDGDVRMGVAKENAALQKTITDDNYMKSLTAQQAEQTKRYSAETPYSILEQKQKTDPDIYAVNKEGALLKGEAGIIKGQMEVKDLKDAQVLGLYNEGIKKIGGFFKVMQTEIRMGKDPQIVVQGLLKRMASDPNVKPEMVDQIEAATNGMTGPQILEHLDGIELAIATAAAKADVEQIRKMMVEAEKTARAEQVAKTKGSSGGMSSDKELVKAAYQACGDDPACRTEYINKALAQRRVPEQSSSVQKSETVVPQPGGGISFDTNTNTQKGATAAPSATPAPSPAGSTKVIGGVTYKNVGGVWRAVK